MQGLESGQGNDRSSSYQLVLAANHGQCRVDRISPHNRIQPPLYMCSISAKIFPAITNYKKGQSNFIIVKY